MKLGTKRLRTGLAIAALSLSMILTGCGKDTTADKSSRTKPSASATNATTKPKQEDKFAATAKLSSSFPKEIPLAKGAVKQSSKYSPTGKVSGFLVAIAVHGDVATAAKQARADLTGAGFKVVSETKASGYSSTVFQNKSWQVTVQVAQGNPVTVNYQVLPRTKS